MHMSTNQGASISSLTLCFCRIANIILGLPLPLLLLRHVKPVGPLDGVEGVEGLGAAEGLVEEVGEEAAEGQGVAVEILQLPVSGMGGHRAAKGGCTQDKTRRD